MVSNNLSSWTALVVFSVFVLPWGNCLSIFLQPTEDPTIYLQRKSFFSHVLLFNGSCCLVPIGTTPIKVCCIWWHTTTSCISSIQSMRQVFCLSFRLKCLMTTSMSKTPQAHEHFCMNTKKPWQSGRVLLRSRAFQARGTWLSCWKVLNWDIRVVILKLKIYI